MSAAMQQGQVAALEVRNLKKSFGGLPATNDVSLTVMPGERRLIIGPNGAGKTTLFNQIAGDLFSDSGSIKLYGEEEIKEVTDEDREDGGVGSSGLVYTGSGHTDGFCYLMMKDKAEHPRLLKVLVILDAVAHLKDEKEKDREKYIKILLGEV